MSESEVIISQQVHENCSKETEMPINSYCSDFRVGVKMFESKLRMTK